MKYQTHRERSPFDGFEQCLQIALDFISVHLARESKTPCNPPHVSIDHQARLAEDMAEQNVRGFATDTWQRFQSFTR